jgi:rRNA-processing protein FCF1
LVYGETQEKSAVIRQSVLDKKRNFSLGESNLAVSKEKLKVVLDSNFLFVPSQFHLDIFEELENLLNQRFEPIILSSTQKELQGLAESSSPKKRKQAQLALRLAEECHAVPAEKGLSETYDDVIVRVAAEWKSPVATNDRELRRRLRNLGVPVIFLRQKQRLELEGAV